ncbi:hypothetical protein GGX14DRAFT_635451 [Mycena pura]|uniref:Uncharacterized protein n=1 Tax=Mycena pura TaxID=153505 RepID=A0AAD6Y9U7_9AGAR|nr:hypothetical protein GGX14DRAFT_635451 [Mycena pura]
MVASARVETGRLGERFRHRVAQSPWRLRTWLQGPGAFGSSVDAGMVRAGPALTLSQAMVSHASSPACFCTPPFLSLEHLGCILVGMLLRRMKVTEGVGTLRSHPTAPEFKDVGNLSSALDASSSDEEDGLSDCESEEEGTAAATPNAAATPEATLTGDDKLLGKRKNRSSFLLSAHSQRSWYQGHFVLVSLGDVDARSRSPTRDDAMDEDTEEPHVHWTFVILELQALHVIVSFLACDALP